MTLATGTATLAPSGRNRLAARHPWIFRDDLAAVDAEDGAVARVLDPSGRFRALALCSAASKIALRIVSYEDEPVDEAFWRARLDRAIDARDGAADEARRLVHSEADGIPGLVVDRYADHVVVQTATAALERLRELVLDHLVRRLRPACVVERNDAPARRLEGLPRRSGVLHGEPADEVLVREGEVRVAVDVLGGQKTGWYLDQRENRLAAGRLARGRALDLFSYQGGFGLQLARGAEEVLCVDSSGASLDRARANAERNGLRNLRVEKAKAFDWLRDARGGDRFDVISADPPAFAKRARERSGAERGYRELNLRALELLAPGGVLVTSSCSYHLSEERFLAILRQAAARSRRTVRLVERRTQAPDHPILLTHPESAYLKCFVLRAE